MLKKILQKFRKVKKEPQQASQASQVSQLPEASQVSQVSPMNPLLLLKLQKITTLDQVKEWKEHPEYHPINKVIIEISISPKSDYVKLYKDAITILVNYKINEKDSGKSKLGFKNRSTVNVDMLSIDDCKFIRKNLPDAHTKVDDGFTYDHLFIKYFINKEKKFKYDKNYIAYGTDIFLYLELYKIIKRKLILKSLPRPIYTRTLSSMLLTDDDLRPFDLRTLSSQKKSTSSKFVNQYSQTVKDFLTGNINNSLLMKSEISVSKLIENVCNDINNVLYLNILYINNEHYENIIKNRLIFNYVYNIYKIAKFNDRINITVDFGKGVYSKDLLHIYNIIINDTIIKKKIQYIFPIFINIYDKIIELYDHLPSYFYNKIKYTKETYDSSCLEKEDPITLDEFEAYNEDNGTVSLIPYNNNKKVSYHCFFTEEIFKYIIEEYKNQRREVLNPLNRKPFQPDDINLICNNMQQIGKFQISNKIGSGTRKHDGRVKGLFHFTFSIDIEKKIQDTSEPKDGILEIIDSSYIYLVIDLGGIHKIPINFNVINKPLFDYASIMDTADSFVLEIPIFNKSIYTSNIVNLIKEIDKKGFKITQNGAFYRVIDIDQIQFNKGDKGDAAELVYTEYTRFFKGIIDTTEGGGSKKRIIKSKPKRRSKKTI